MCSLLNNSSLFGIVIVNTSHFVVITISCSKSCPYKLNLNQLYADLFYVSFLKYGISPSPHQLIYQLTIGVINTLLRIIIDLCLST